MADIAVDRLVVLIEAQTRSFELQIKKLEGQINNFSKKTTAGFNAMNKSMMAVGSTFAKVFGLSLGIGLLTEFPRLLIGSVKALGDLKDAATKAGISVKALQQLTFAGIGTGTSMDQLVTSFERFNKVLGQSQLKGGGLAAFFGTNAISGDTVDKFVALGDLIKNAANEQERTVIATTALGKAGAEMLPFFMQGSAEIRKLMQAAEDAGFVTKTSLVDAADDFGDKWEMRIAAWKKQFMGAAAEIARAIDFALTPANEQTLSQIKARIEVVRHNIELLKKDWAGQLIPGWLNMPGGMLDQLTELAQLQAKLRGMTPQHHPSGSAKTTGVAGLVEASKSVKEYKKALDELTPAQQRFIDMQEKMADAAQGTADALKGFVDSVVDDFHSAGAALESMFKNLTKQMIDAMLFGGGPFAGLMGTQGQGGNPGGAIGGLLSKVFANFGGVGGGSFKSNAVGSAGMFRSGGGGGGGPSAATAPVGAVTSRGGSTARGVPNWEIFGRGGAGAVGSMLKGVVNPDGTMGQTFAGGSSGLSGVKGQIWDFFASKGLKPHQIAGIMGNVGHESAGFNPQAVGPGGDLGLFQYMGLRQKAFLQSIGGRGNLGDVNQQLEFAWSELQGPEGATLKRLMAAGNVRDATSAFAGFERAPGYSVGNPTGINGWQNRFNIAQQFSGVPGAPAAVAPPPTIATAAMPGGDLLKMLLSLFGGMAKGGPISGPKIVGEHGPELYVPRAPGTIVPNGGMTVNIHNNAGVAVRTERSGINMQDLSVFVEQKAADVTNRLNRGVFGLKPVAIART